MDHPSENDKNLDPQTLIFEASNTVITREKALRILTMLEPTNLSEDASADDIRHLCASASTPVGETAAVCVSPKFVETAFDSLRHNTVKIATVINFPHGEDDINEIANMTEDVVNAGAQEIDIVLPYKAFLDGHFDHVVQSLRACRQACGQHVIMKVILETGALISKENIQNATRMAIDCGADFIKTSTGFGHTGATLETAFYILEVLHERQQKNQQNTDIGLKISGGLKTANIAAQFLKLSELVMGKEWVDSYTLRFGASQLLEEIIETIGIESTNPQEI